MNKEKVLQTEGKERCINKGRADCNRKGANDCINEGK